MMVLRVTRMRIMLLSCGNLSLDFHKLSGKISRKISCSFGDEISKFIPFDMFCNFYECDLYFGGKFLKISSIVFVPGMSEE